MMGFMFNLLVEFFVAILLMTTIAYCILVNRKLTRLNADQEALKDTIRELDRSTRIAESAIDTLKSTVDTAEQELAGRIDSATTVSQALSQKLQNATEVVDRLAEFKRTSQILPEVNKPSQAKSILPPKPRVSLDPDFSLRRLMAKSQNTGNQTQPVPQRRPKQKDIA